MTNDTHASDTPATPLCATFEPLLPLLPLGELEPGEAEALRAHVDTCAWCGARSRELALVGAALRAALARDERPEPALALTMGAIMRTMEEREAGTPAAAPAETNASPVSPIPTGHGPRRGRGSRLTPYVGLAAALAVALLAGLVFASRGRGAGTTGTGSPTATATATAAAPRVARYPLPAGSRPLTIVGVDGAGNAWFWVGMPGHIGSTLYRMSAQGAFTHIALPDVGPHLVVARVEADGTLWLLSADSGQIWHFDPATGAVTPIAMATSIPRVDGLAVAPDGTFWLYTSLAGEYGEFVRVDPRTGASRAFPLPERIGDMSAPAADAHGVIWFATEETPNSYVVRFDTNTGRMLKIEVGHLTHADPISFPPSDGLRASPDGGAWAVVGADERVVGPYAGGTLSTEGRKLLRVRPDGSVALYPFSAGGQYAGGFGVDAASNLWYLADTGAQRAPDGTLPASAAILIERVSPDGSFQTTASVPMRAFVTADTASGEAYFGADGSVWLPRVGRDTAANVPIAKFLVRIAPAW
jgi:streptogramin lyase